ncbi:MAG: hypothetical protein QME45_07935 [Clostridiales bacterium]|nr:hypothetical protein [Clostridiales bacterium]
MFQRIAKVISARKYIIIIILVLLFAAAIYFLLKKPHYKIPARAMFVFLDLFKIYL